MHLGVFWERSNSSPKYNKILEVALESTSSFLKTAYTKILRPWACRLSLFFSHGAPLLRDQQYRTELPRWTNGRTAFCLCCVERRSISLKSACGLLYTIEHLAAIDDGPIASLCVHFCCSVNEQKAEVGCNFFYKASGQLKTSGRDRGSSAQTIERTNDINRKSKNFSNLIL